MAQCNRWGPGYVKSVVLNSISAGQDPFGIELSDKDFPRNTWRGGVQNRNRSKLKRARSLSLNLILGGHDLMDSS